MAQPLTENIEDSKKSSYAVKCSRSWEVCAYYEPQTANLIYSDNLNDHLDS